MYYDLLAKIKNGEMAKKESIISPFSRMDFSVAEILKKSKYIKDFQKKIINKKNFLEIKLAYKDSKPALSDFRIISKPSRHIYFGYRDMKPIKRGYGIGVLSTPDGIITTKDARKNKVGGEYLFEAW